MNSESKKKDIILPIGAIVSVVLMVLVFLDAPSEWLVGLLLLNSAFTAGLFLGGAGRREAHGADMSDVSEQPIVSAGAGADADVDVDVERETAGCDSADNMLRDLLDELTSMQNSTDLLDRYQCFTRVAESILSRSVGAGGVSLWCPDDKYENLVECVIKPTRLKHLDGRYGRGRSDRTPCVVPLDSADIRRSLKFDTPVLTGSLGLTVLAGEQFPEQSLRCDGCIPLFREHGQPLLVIFERTADSAKDDNEQAFSVAVNMIKSFWDQLQGINQRQWLIEHEINSGALRGDAFLREAQGWADQLHQQDELFTVVVITVRGFRSMFAGKSAQWRDLYSVVGRCLSDMLIAQGEKFLLGAMADDVLALLLPHKDAFLSELLMKNIVVGLSEQMQGSTELELTDVLAIELQWRCADHRRYQRSIQRHLDGLYSKLFGEADSDGNYSFRIVLNQPMAELESR